MKVTGLWRRKQMKKSLSLLLAAGIIFTVPLLAYGEGDQAKVSLAIAADDETSVEISEEAAKEEDTEAQAEAPGEEAAGSQEAAAAQSETSGQRTSSEYVYLVNETTPVTTSHSATINGQDLDYTAEVGSLIFSNGEAECEMFYTAYTLDGVEDRSERPVTFAYNGGPGAGSACVNLLFIGPRRLELDDEGNSVSLPPKFEDNEFSILDLTDLVFIDAIGGGFSRETGGSDPAAFYNYYGDCQAVGNFIWLYLNSKGRWSSPKYLLGESYGTVRSMGVCEYLNDALSLPLNGLIQVSSIHDYSMLTGDRNVDSVFARNLPTFAADAWYHKKVDDAYQSMELEDFLSEVCTFADMDYMAALSKGDSLTDEEFNAAAEKISGFIGLDIDYVKSQNLRISMEDFCTELLRDQKLIIGRMDGKVTGPITNGSIGGGSNDPSFKSVISDLGASIYQYYGDELGYHSDYPYNQLNSDANAAWTFPGNAIYPFNQAETIYNNISNNRFLKVWVLCGYYDLATPFHAAEWTYNHLFLNESCKSQVRFTYYKGGHMFYLDREDHEKFHRDAEAWFNS